MGRASLLGDYSREGDMGLMEFVYNMVEFLVTVAILNVVPWSLGSNYRFGWYKKGGYNA